MRINRELIWNVVDELQSLQYTNEDLSVTTISTLIDNIIDMYESCIIEIVESMIFGNERDITQSYINSRISQTKEDMIYHWSVRIWDCSYSLPSEKNRELVRSIIDRINEESVIRIE